jgi:hypothetical protein
MKTQKEKKLNRNKVISFFRKLAVKFQHEQKMQQSAVAENDWVWHYSY